MYFVYILGTTLPQFWQIIVRQTLDAPQRSHGGDTCRSQTGRRPNFRGETGRLISEKIGLFRQHRANSPNVDKH